MVCNAVRLCTYTGHLVMGDATYNHIYNSTGSVTQRTHPDIAAEPEEGEQLAIGAHEEEPRAGPMSPDSAGDDGIDALHDAIVSNTDGSAPIIMAAGTPTGAALGLLASCAHTSAYG